MPDTFRVGLTRDFLEQDGSLGYGNIGLGLLDAAAITRFVLDANAPVLTPELIDGANGLLVLAPKITEETLADASQLVVVSRFGVGYDNVDVAACTRQGVMVTITPDGVRRPVALAAITLLLALSHKLLIKDRLTRQGRWSEKLAHMGTGITQKTLGIIGLGNIGRELARLASGFDLRVIAFDPQLSDAPNGVELCSIDELLERSDFVCVCCVLSPQTHHLINASRLARMKPTAYLVNVARGPIVDQRALIEALQTGRLAGAGLDVFEYEPIDPDDPLLRLDNVIVSPHALCWTDECFLGIGTSACRSLVDVSQGRIPEYVVNREVLDSPIFKQKLNRWIRP